MKPTQDEIAKRAYLLWEKGGRQPGHDQEYWFQAEAELMAASQPGAKALTAHDPKATAAKPGPVTPHIVPKTNELESRKPRARAA